jgi:hypothetical protein
LAIFGDHDDHDNQKMVFELSLPPLPHFSVGNDAFCPADRFVE